MSGVKSSGLVGRWLHPGGNIVEVYNPEGLKLVGRWRGSKGGPAGFSAKIEGSDKARGFWFDEDSGLFEKDNAHISLSVSSEGDSFSADAGAKGGGSATASTFVCKKYVVPRNKTGLLSGFAFKDAAIFKRLTLPMSDAAAADAARLLVLTQSMTDAAKSHSFDGCITYIPPLAIGDAFDDAAMRRHQEQSRHRGKKLTAGVIARASKSTSFPWERDEYKDASTLHKEMRAAEKAHAAASVSPALRERRKFRPSNNTSVAADVTAPPQIFLSAGLVDRDSSPAKIRELASAAVHAKKAEMSASLRKVEGKIEVLLRSPNVKAGFAHWTLEAEKGYPHLLPEQLAEGKAPPKRRILEAALAEEIQRRRERKPFSPVGVLITRAEGAAAGGAGGEAPPPPRPESPPTKADADKKGDERKPFNPYSHYDLDAAMARDRAAAPPPLPPPPPSPPRAAKGAADKDVEEKKHWHQEAVIPGLVRYTSSVALLPKNIKHVIAKVQSMTMGGAPS